MEAWSFLCHHYHMHPYFIPRGLHRMYCVSMLFPYHRKVLKNISWPYDLTILLIGWENWKRWPQGGVKSLKNHSKMTLRHHHSNRRRLSITQRTSMFVYIVIYVLNSISYQYQVPILVGGSPVSLRWWQMIIFWPPKNDPKITFCEKKKKILNRSPIWPRIQKDHKKSYNY